MTSGKQIDHEMQPRKRTTPGWWHRLGIFCLLLAATASTLAAQTLTTLVSFDGTNGKSPGASLVQGGDGNLYGTVTAGGANNGGTVFKVSPGGTLTTLYSFCAQTTCPDGLNLYSAVVLGSDGDFYGTTFQGGSYGWGTVYKITPSGTLITLHSFCAQSNCTDGGWPSSPLIQATDGNFYGTTDVGGTSTACGITYGCGTVFKMTPSGTLTILHSFDGTDGSDPGGPLVQARDGNFYGITSEGGATLYYGTIFKMTASGTLTTLYTFCSETNCADGADPNGLIQATDGNLYGTTYGYISGDGTVFRITPKGTLTTLYGFEGTDGAFPNGPLVQATDGDFYGTTQEGGTNTGCTLYGCGTIFKITPSGTLTTLYDFCSQGGPACPDGEVPYAGVIQATNGNFYGGTYEGGTSTACGSYGCGTVFSLSVGLSPFVETLPTLGPVGAPVRILGTGLTGTTSVTFNGTPATTFTVNSTGTAINTTVPSGATTGTVQVVTPGGTLSSNVIFRVRQ